MSVTMGCFGDMSPREFPLRISLMRISSGQQMLLTAFRGRIWGTALQKNSLKHSLTLFAQPERLRQPQFWLNLTLQPKLWLRWNSFFYRWVSNLNLQFAIRDYCLEIQKTISRYGNDFQIFDSDGDYQRSIAFSILQIGELGGSLSEAYRKETCNRIQWGPIKGMRNMVAHSYGSMSREIIWETATMDIPVLLNFCEEQLKEK